MAVPQNQQQSQQQRSNRVGDDRREGEIDSPRLNQRFQFQQQDSNMRRTLQSIDQAPQRTRGQAGTYHRRLCEGVDNHCFKPEEKNVFSPPIPPPPTMAPTIALVSDRTDDTTNSCRADEQGNYGEIDGPTYRIVSYRFQLETTTQVSSALELNVNVLQDVETTISDYIIHKLFIEVCSSPPTLVLMPNDNNAQQPQLQSIAKSDDSSRMGTDLEGLHNRLVRNRNMKTEDHDVIKGLSAEPMDQVLDGCKFSFSYQALHTICFLALLEHYNINSMCLVTNIMGQWPALFLQLQDRAL
jgi:hypothetical protein